MATHPALPLKQEGPGGGETNVITMGAGASADFLARIINFKTIYRVS
jgi:hypothetical protein